MTTDVSRTAERWMIEFDSLFYSIRYKKEKTAFLLEHCFVVTRTRIVKASLDDLLRKYPILYPFRLRPWRTAERWMIEFDSLFYSIRYKKKKQRPFWNTALW